MRTTGERPVITHPFFPAGYLVVRDGKPSVRATRMALESGLTPADVAEINKARLSRKIKVKRK
jgi:hypothetical protein